MQPFHATAIAIAAALAFGPTASAQTPDQSLPPRDVGAPMCNDFATDQEAVAYCMERFGLTLYCGGRDRDRDEMPCECNAGGPQAEAQACRSRQKGEK